MANKVNPNCNNTAKVVLPLAAVVTGTLALSTLAFGILALVQHRIPALKLGSLSTYLLQHQQNAQIIGNALVATSLPPAAVTVVISLAVLLKKSSTTQADHSSNSKVDSDDSKSSKVQKEPVNISNLESIGTFEMAEDSRNKTGAHERSTVFIDGEKQENPILVSVPPVEAKLNDSTILIRVVDQKRRETVSYTTKNGKKATITNCFVFKDNDNNEYVFVPHVSNPSKFNVYPLPKAE